MASTSVEWDDSFSVLALTPHFEDGNAVPSPLSILPGNDQVLRRPDSAKFLKIKVVESTVDGVQIEISRPSSSPENGSFTIISSDGLFTLPLEGIEEITLTNIDGTVAATVMFMFEVNENA